MNRNRSSGPLCSGDREAMYLLWFFFSLLSRTSYAQLLSKKAASSSRTMAGNAEFGSKNYDEVRPFGLLFDVRKSAVAESACYHFFSYFRIFL